MAQLPPVSPVPAVPPVLAATGPFFMFSLEETFELIGEAGFDGAELMIMQDKVSQDPLRLGALAARYGVPVPAVHGPFLVATWLVFGTDPKGKLERCVRFAETAKVSTVVIHPPYRWQVQYADWLDEAIPRIREETGVTIAVENMFAINVNGRSLRFFSGTTPSELGRWPYLVLDTSHLAVAGGDLLAAWDELADRVVHLHVSNNDGRGSRHPRPAGPGRAAHRRLPPGGRGVRLRRRRHPRARRADVGRRPPGPARGAPREPRDRPDPAGQGRQPPARPRKPAERVESAPPCEPGPPLSWPPCSS